MLTTTIPAYLYTQYADDDDLQAFILAYNQAAQSYVDWFNNNNLAFYPGLSGPLLDWVAEGLYGLSRTALQSQRTAALGPLNTVVLNSTAGFPLNAFVFPVSTFYELTDDLFQRVLTWDFYKADGKRFCIQWLKRRILRFLIGINGLDVQGNGVTNGTEQQRSVSVSIASGVVTVTINQALLSFDFQGLLVPNILPIFQAAFQSGAGGVLDLPAQFTYVCSIQTGLVASITPNPTLATGSVAALTTPAATVGLIGGSGNYTFAWSFLSGGSGITITSSTAQSTTFSASGLTPGQIDTGTIQCLVTDTFTSQTATATATVTIARVTLPSVVIAPTSVSLTQANNTLTAGINSATVTGGVAPYTYAWSWQSGGTGITINSPSSAVTSFTASGVTPGQTLTGTALLTVTDNVGQQTTATVPVSLARPTLVSAVAAPTSLAVITASGGAVGTTSTTVTPSGGGAPYVYSWAWQSGGASITIGSPHAATTAFSSTGLTPGENLSGIAACTVTDTFGQTAQATVNVSIDRATLVTAVVNPTTQSSSSALTTQTTGTSTVSVAGGVAPYAFSWVWSSGGTNIAINTPTISATSFTGSSLVNGNTYSGVAQCTVTDALGQVAQVTVSVSILCAALVRSYTNQAATTDTIPANVSQVVIEGWGNGGNGGNGFISGCVSDSGGGGGAGGYFRKTLSIPSTAWGKTISVGATIPGVSAAVVVSSGSFTLSTLTANIGHGGGAASLGTPGAGGAGGNATGGDVNTTGGVGGNGTAGGAGGHGGVPVSGLNGGPFGNGGNGGKTGVGVSGAVGGVVIRYS